MTFLRQTFRRERGLLRVLNAAVVIAWLVSLAVSAATNPPRENQIKAAGFFNVIAFTEWPEAAFASADSPLVVGVLGQGEIADLLEEFLSNETWRGRRVTVRRLAAPIDARSCHVLYVAQSEHSRWPVFKSQFAGFPILTISDAGDFARQGGVVEFAIKRNELRLIVNLGVARSCGLTLSSKVLRLADVIDDRVP